MKSLKCQLTYLHIDINEFKNDFENVHTYTQYRNYTVSHRKYQDSV